MQILEEKRKTMENPCIFNLLYTFPVSDAPPISRRLNPVTGLTQNSQRKAPTPHPVSCWLPSLSGRWWLAMGREKTPIFFLAKPIWVDFK